MLLSRTAQEVEQARLSLSSCICVLDQHRARSGASMFAVVSLHVLFVRGVNLTHCPRGHVEALYMCICIYDAIIDK